MKGKFSSTTFNAQFEKSVSNAPVSKHLIKYKEPEAMFTGKKIQYTELGVDTIDDFSGANLTNKNLNYMDLKIAHSTQRIVDPKTVNDRREYKSINDIEADRSQVSYSMSEKDMRDYEKRKRQDERKEQQRLQVVNTQDQMSQRQFDTVNRLMLGGRQ